MVKKVLIILCVLLPSVMSGADWGDGVVLDSVMATEAESFLRSMPDGLQARQRERQSAFRRCCAFADQCLRNTM